MIIDADLERIALQEKALQFDSFSLATGWALGSLLREMAVERKLGVVIDVTLFSMPVFYAALEGSTPDNPNWVRRKRNCVFRFLKSSYAVGLSLAKQGTDITSKFGLPEAESRRTAAVFRLSSRAPAVSERSPFRACRSARIISWSLRRLPRYSARILAGCSSANESGRTDANGHCRVFRDVERMAFASGAAAMAGQGL